MMIETIGKAIRANFAISANPKKPFLCDVYEISPGGQKVRLFEDSPYIAIVMFVGLADKYLVDDSEIELYLSIDPNQRREFKKAFDDIMQRHDINPNDYRVFEGNYEGNKRWNIKRFHNKYKICVTYIREKNRKFLDKNLEYLIKTTPKWYHKLKSGEVTFNGQRIT